MFNLTYMLMVFAFLLIAVVFLVMGIVLRSKIVKDIANIVNNQSTDSAKDAYNIVERTKKLLWYFGITYVTIALAVFLEGAFGMLEQPVFDTVFIIMGVVLFIFGVLFTAYGILAMYNTNEKKFGTLRKAYLTTICNLKDGKKLLVLSPSNKFGVEALNGADALTDDKLANFRQANGRSLDFCVVDDASEYKMGVEYLIYSSVLRIKYKGVTIAFVTKNAFDASVSTFETKEEVKPVAEKKDADAKLEAELGDIIAEEKPAKKSAKKSAEKVASKKQAKVKTETAVKPEKPAKEKKPAETVKAKEKTEKKEKATKAESKKEKPSTAKTKTAKATKEKKTVKAKK